MPRLSRINVFPIKSFDGVAVESSAFVPGGGLKFDRRFAIFTERGELVNGKKFPIIHRLRSDFAPDFSEVTLTPTDGVPRTFRLAAGNAELDGYLSQYFGQPIRVEENSETGFMDDLGSPGPTVLAEATLETVRQWFPSLDLEEVRRRFRANLEFADCPAFWEDRLFAEDASPESRETVPFRVGSVTLHGVNPCARCPVPTRDSRTGAVYEKFGAQFQLRRRETLPPWAATTAFDHFYRLSVNTRPSPVRAADALICLGDEVDVLPQ